MTQIRQGILSGADYLSLPRDHETYLLRPLIPTSGAAIIYGDSKVGKTYMGLQLALALAGQAPEWLGFPVGRSGRVVYLQLDTPGLMWSERLKALRREGLPIESLFYADRETLEFYPFDILHPQHAAYLRTLLQDLHPTVVFMDTIREAHSGDEDSSTIMRNVIANLVAATTPAALILISHARKPSQDQGNNLMADNRGSSYVVGRMDAIIRLTKRHLYYTGRSIEEGSIKLERGDNGLWTAVQDESSEQLARVVADTQLKTMRAKARVLAPLIHKSEEAAMSAIRRYVEAQKGRFHQTSKELDPNVWIEEDESSPTVTLD